MTEAMENRRQVVRRARADADFTVVEDRLDGYWQQQAAKLEGIWDEGDPGSKVFRECVLDGLADSVVCMDADGRLVYPAPVEVPPVSHADSDVDWAGAERLEHEEGEFDEAASAYGAIVSAHGDVTQEAFDANVAGRALLAQARCLAKAGQADVAVELLTGTLGRPEYSQAVDSGGRLIVAAAELRALDLLDDAKAPRFRTIVERLSRRLDDYDEPLLGAAQRQFLMHQLREAVADRQPVPEDLRAFLTRAVDFPTLKAEQLAAEFWEANPVPSKDAVVRLTQSPGVWQLASANTRVYAIFRTEGVLSRSRGAIASRGLKSGAEVTLLPPGEKAASHSVVHSAEAGRYLPGWRLSYSPAAGDDEPIADAQIAAYFWTGILVIGAMSMFSAIIAQAFRRQIRLSRLKNDLVATVSHELKTPLASIRLLVDTLLDEPELREEKVREYLELVAKENLRLSRLIDNFLAFSRMERNRHAFEFAEIRPGDVIRATAEVVRERFSSPECQLDVEVAAGLETILADADALTTVLLNLLDNAWKYSGDEKHIVLRAFAEDGDVCFEVEDNGIGLSKAATRRVFRRFYQVDRRVSRESGGVGLGLSIVQFIVTAHEGKVRVRSRPGQGSAFTVTIPRAPGASPERQGATG